MATDEHFQTVCTTDEIAVGQARVFPLGETVIAVFRIGDEFFALEDRCPHAGASLALGTLEGDIIRCRIHHWGFSLRDGRYVDEDRPSCHARAFAVRVVDDQVQVRLG